MDRFLVRRAPAAVAQSTQGRAAEPPPAKRAKVPGGQGGSDAAQTGLGEPGGDPRTLISWNVNGLLPQLKSNWTKIEAFLDTERPDLFCLQEVRLPAKGPRGAKKGDGQRRQRGIGEQDSKQGREDWSVIEGTLLAFARSHYDVFWSLADYKYSGTALFVRRPLKPRSVSFTLPALCKFPQHRDRADATVHPEGRIIMCSFATFDVLATYAPNNGSDPASFERRAAWDAALLEDLAAWTRPLIWIGDLNCAPAVADVTEPEWFLRQCYQGDPPDMRGQPGFTPGERERFAGILGAAGLVDVHRRLHPASEPPPSEGPHYTWRGHPPVNGTYAKYFGRGMRIDHACVAEALLPRIEASEILGHGSARLGFMGSDHCPIKLTMRPAEQTGRASGACE